MAGDGYMGNPLVKGDNVAQNFTKEEVAEYMKCMSSPEYFATKYIKVIAPSQGLIDFKPYSYQKELFKKFNENRFNIVLACRESSKSIWSVCYLLLTAVFKPE